MSHEADGHEGERQGAIDEQLHSRQLAVYGRETMRRLAGANVLVSGLGGLGQEIGPPLTLFLLRCSSLSLMMIAFVPSSVFLTQPRTSSSPA